MYKRVKRIKYIDQTKIHKYKENRTKKSEQITFKHKAKVCWNSMA